MHIGLAMFPTEDVPLPGVVARMAENRGFESLWFAEHTHLPVGTRDGGGHDPGMRYRKTIDPFVAMTAAASATATLRVGTGVCLVTQRDPIVTANEVASVDLLSGGRMSFGVGAGWNRPELRNHGTDPRTRMRLFAERMHAMIEIWTHDEASFHGDFVDFDPIWSWPKPVQKPYPPIVVGGDGPTVEERILDFGDEWMPNLHDEAALLERWRRLNDRAGRVIPLTLTGVDNDPSQLSRFRDLGVHRSLAWLPQNADDGVVSLGETERFLDELAAAAAAGLG
jgi:probable F420-dependent oxidoreductase